MSNYLKEIINHRREQEEAHARSVAALPPAPAGFVWQLSDNILGLCIEGEEFKGPFHRATRDLEDQSSWRIAVWLDGRTETLGRAIRGRPEAAQVLVDLVEEIQEYEALSEETGEEKQEEEERQIAELVLTKPSYTPEEVMDLILIVDAGVSRPDSPALRIVIHTDETAKCPVEDYEETLDSDQVSQAV